MLMLMSGGHLAWLAVAAAVLLGMPGLASAHGVSSRDASFVQSIDGLAIAAFFFLQRSFAANAMLMAGGFLMTGYQIVGCFEG